MNMMRLPNVDEIADMLPDLPVDPIHSHSTYDDDDDDLGSLESDYTNSTANTDDLSFPDKTHKSSIMNMMRLPNVDEIADMLPDLSVDPIHSHLTYDDDDDDLGSLESDYTYSTANTDDLSFPDCDLSVSSGRSRGSRGSHSHRSGRSRSSGRSGNSGSRVSNNGPYSTTSTSGQDVIPANIRAGRRSSSSSSARGRILSQKVVPTIAARPPSNQIAPTTRTLNDIQLKLGDLLHEFQREDEEAVEADDTSEDGATYSIICTSKEEILIPSFNTVDTKAVAAVDDDTSDFAVGAVSVKDCVANTATTVANEDAFELEAASKEIFTSNDSSTTQLIESSKRRKWLPGLKKKKSSKNKNKNKNRKSWGRSRTKSKLEPIAEAASDDQLEAKDSAQALELGAIKNTGNEETATADNNENELPKILDSTEAALETKAEPQSTVPVAVSQTDAPSIVERSTVQTATCPPLTVDELDAKLSEEEAAREEKVESKDQEIAIATTSVVDVVGAEHEPKPTQSDSTIPSVAQDAIDSKSVIDSEPISSGEKINEKIVSNSDGIETITPSATIHIAELQSELTQLALVIEQNEQKRLVQEHRRKVGLEAAMIGMARMKAVMRSMEERETNDNKKMVRFDLECQELERSNSHDSHDSHDSDGSESSRLSREEQANLNAAECIGETLTQIHAVLALQCAKCQPIVAIGQGAQTSAEAMQEAKDWTLDQIVSVLRKLKVDENGTTAIDAADQEVLEPVMQVATEECVIEEIVKVEEVKEYDKEAEEPKQDQVKVEQEREIKVDEPKEVSTIDEVAGSKQQEEVTNNMWWFNALPLPFHIDFGSPTKPVTPPPSEKKDVVRAEDLANLLKEAEDFIQEEKHVTSKEAEDTNKAEKKDAAQMAVEASECLTTEGSAAPEPRVIENAASEDFIQEEKQEEKHVTSKEAEDTNKAEKKDAAQMAVEASECLTTEGSAAPEPRVIENAASSTGHDNKTLAVATYSIVYMGDEDEDFVPSSDVVDSNVQTKEIPVKDQAKEVPANAEAAAEEAPSAPERASKEDGATYSIICTSKEEILIPSFNTVDTKVQLPVKAVAAVDDDTSEDGATYSIICTSKEEILIPSFNTVDTKAVAAVDDDTSDFAVGAVSVKDCVANTATTVANEDAFELEAASKEIFTSNDSSTTQLIESSKRRKWLPGLKKKKSSKNKNKNKNRKSWGRSRTKSKLEPIAEAASDDQLEAKDSAQALELGAIKNTGNEETATADNNENELPKILDSTEAALETKAEPQSTVPVAVSQTDAPSIVERSTVQTATCPPLTVDELDAKLSEEEAAREEKVESKDQEIAIATTSVVDVVGAEHEPKPTQSDSTIPSVAQDAIDSKSVIDSEPISSGEKINEKIVSNSDGIETITPSATIHIANDSAEATEDEVEDAAEQRHRRELALVRMEIKRKADEKRRRREREEAEAAALAEAEAEEEELHRRELARVRLEIKRKADEERRRREKEEAEAAALAEAEAEAKEEERRRRKEAQARKEAKRKADEERRRLEKEEAEAAALAEFNLLHVENESTNEGDKSVNIDGNTFDDNDEEDFASTELRLKATQEIFLEAELLRMEAEEKRRLAVSLQSEIEVAEKNREEDERLQAELVAAEIAECFLVGNSSTKSKDNEESDNNDAEEIKDEKEENEAVEKEEQVEQIVDDLDLHVGEEILEVTRKIADIEAEQKLMEAARLKEETERLMAETRQIEENLRAQERFDQRQLETEEIRAQEEALKAQRLEIEAEELMLEAQQISETLQEKKLKANAGPTIKKKSGLPPKKPSSLPPRPSTAKGLKNTPIRKRSTSPGSASVCTSVAAASTVSKMSTTRGLKKDRNSSSSVARGGPPVPRRRLKVFINNE